MFTRTKGDLNNYFNLMGKDRPVELLAKYRKALNLDEHWDLSTLVNSGNMISDFKIFINKTLIMMEVFSKHCLSNEFYLQRTRGNFSKMLENRDNHDINYSKNQHLQMSYYLETLINNLMKYEETNLDFYVDSDLSMKLVSHTDQENIKNKIKSTVRINDN